MRQLGPFIRAGSAEEAASANIVFVAVRWVSVETALKGLPAWMAVSSSTKRTVGSSLETKDPSNPLAAFGIKALDLGDTYSSAILRELVPGA
jgi:predicted dinucleotide-binding enzyme